MLYQRCCWYSIFYLFVKRLKINFFSYRVISLLSNTHIVLEGLMYNGLFNFLEINRVIDDSLFGSGQKYSYFDPINGQNKRKNGQWKFCLWNICYLQTAFHTVGHDILIQRLNRYDIRGVANNWFFSCL